MGEVDGLVGCYSQGELIAFVVAFREHEAGVVNTGIVVIFLPKSFEKGLDLLGMAFALGPIFPGKNEVTCLQSGEVVR